MQVMAQSHYGDHYAGQYTGHYSGHYGGYYGGHYGGHHDNHHGNYSRSSHRASTGVAATAAYYDRSAPYSQSYRDHSRRQLRSEQSVRSGHRTIVHEPSPEASQPTPARRRIQVACSRCRRRKIKCSGDPGDGSGCAACQTTGADGETCNFVRVGSQVVNIPIVEMIAASSMASTSAPTQSTYSSSEATPITYDSSARHRASLPTLQTRGVLPQYDAYSAYNTSPVEDYKYTTSAIPRQASSTSSSSTYGAENFRPYTSTSISNPAASASTYYEPVGASFGTLHAAPSFPSTAVGHVANYAGDGFSPLSMDSLNSSLPTQTVQERRLPIPYVQTYQPTTYPTTEVPQIRPLATYSESQPRAHINGIHSRSGMPWSTSDQYTSASSRNGSMSNMTATQHHAVATPSSGHSTSSLIGEPILGYQFSTGNDSPDVSPTTSMPALSESFSSASSSSTTSAMLPPSSTFRYSTGNSYQGLPALNLNEMPSRPCSRRDTAASLYSFSTAAVDSCDRSTVSGNHLQACNDDDGTSQHNYAASYSQNASDDGHIKSQHNYSTMRHPQPYHAASMDELRRRSSMDHRATTSHRMSLSNLNTRYQ